MARSTPDENSPLISPPLSTSSSSKNKALNLPVQEGDGERWISRCRRLFTIQPRNQGLLLVLGAEVVGATMDASARFLQQSHGGTGFSVFQVIFFRMSITWFLSSIYSWWTKVPEFPLGNSKIRGLLFSRALFGTMGLFCLYYSVHYLPITEATIIRFLVPLTTTILCSILLSQPFTRRDFVAGIFALIGIIIMAQPEAIFGSPHHKKPQGPEAIEAQMVIPIDPVSPKTHILALSAALLGVFFAASAYTTIRLIGSQAHALISVSYFSSLATIFTFLVMVFHPTPDTTFVLPNNVGDWALLIGLGVAGFILQFLLTKGLQMDKSSRATSMLYLQVVFAATLDWSIWGVLPKGWSWVGGGVVVASTLWLALGKVDPPKDVARPSDEEEGLIREGDGGEEGESEDENSITEDTLVRRSSITA